MNKTFTINLNGRVYHINDDAYDVLNGYLATLKRQFEGEEGAQEIMDDIEARIGELFTERTRYGMQVVTMQDVEDVIGIMGHPEEIAESDSTGEAQAEAGGANAGESAQGNSATGESKKTPKRLFRDPDDKIIAGLCSGLGAYFHTEPWLFRALFIIAFLAGFGTPILLYVVLWIIIPEATSVSQRLQMRGEQANVETIRQAINDGEVAAPKSTNALGEVAGFFFKFVTVIFGGCLGLGLILALLLAGLVFLMPYLANTSMTMLNFGFGNPIVTHNIEFVSNPIPILIALLVAVILPIYVLAHYILHRTKHIAPLSHTSLWALLAIWAVAVASILILIF